MPLIDRSSFVAAVTNVAKRGDTDIFPLPVENHVFHDRMDGVVDLLDQMASEFDALIVAQPPVNHSGLSPAGYNGFRWATQLDPVWNAYLLALMIQLSPAIEQARVPEAQKVAFSYRYNPTADGQLFRTGSWNDFQETSRELAQGTTYVVSVDIADFYSRIYHHRLENELKYVDTTGGLARQVVELLKSISGGVSYGLPVGGPAARILAELLLNATDKLLLGTMSTRFVRYADDYRFFVADMEEAHRCIGNLSEVLLQNEGLSLQRGKTRIFTAKEFLATLRPESPARGSASKFLSLHLHYDPYSSTAEEDYERLRDKLDEFDILQLLRDELSKSRIDAAVTRRIVSALRYLDQTIRLQALQSMLQNVDTLAPVFPQVMRAVREGLADLPESSQLEVQESLRSLVDESSYVTQVNVNLAYIVRALGQTKCQDNERLLVRLYQSPQGFAQTPAPNVQRDILLILARWQARYFLHTQKPHFSTMHEWVQRAFLIGSFALGDEG